MPLTTADAAGLLKEYYLDPLNDAVVRKTVFLDRVEKTDEYVDGEYAYIPVELTRNPAVGSRKEGTGTGPKLPSAGTGSYTAMTYKMAYHYGRASITGPSMRASKSKAGAFAKLLDREMKNLSKTLPEDLNRQLWSYGHGRAATLTDNMTTGQTTFYASATSVFSAKIGDRVHFNKIDDGSDILPSNGDSTITAIAFDSVSGKHLVTISNSPDDTVTASTYAAYFGGSESSMALADTSYAKEMHGIPALVDDGAIGAREAVAADKDETLHGSVANVGGIARASNVQIQAQVLTNPSGAGTNRPLTVALMEEAYLKYMVNGGGDINSLEIYSNPGLWATFGLLHIGDRIYNDYKENFEGGWIGIKFNGRPFFTDRDCPRHVIWFLDMSQCVFLSQTGYEFMDEDGNELSRVTDYDAYEFSLYRDCQLAFRLYNGNTALRDLSQSMNVENKV